MKTVAGQKFKSIMKKGPTGKDVLNKALKEMKGVNK